MPADALAVPPRTENPAVPFWKPLRVYLEFGRVGFVNALAYRLRYFAGDCHVLYICLRVLLHLEGHLRAQHVD